jgi:hypothetical protein
MKKLLTLLLEGDGKMTKKLLVLMLVFGMASLANATVIDVVTVGVGSLGHAGTSQDPLEESETIEIKIILNADPDPTWYQGGGYPAYDGWWLSSMDIALAVSGSGTLSEKGTGLATKMKHNTNFGLWFQSDPLIVGNAISQLSGAALGDGIQGEADLVWNLVIHCDGPGDVLVDLTHNIAGDYSVYANSQGAPWITMVEADLGGLTIYQVPEPATIALLGLGGLFLRRRRK